MILIAAGIVVFLLWVYVLFAREWLDQHLQGTRYAWWHEEIEDKLWSSSRTILVSRGYALAGVLVAIQQLASAAGLDITPVVNELATDIPEKYRGLAIAGFLFLTGIAFEWLRRVTTQPVGEGGK